MRPASAIVELHPPLSLVGRKVSFLGGVFATLGPDTLTGHGGARKRFPDRDEIASVRAEGDGVEAGGALDVSRRLAGRVMARRDMGKLVFLDLVDRSGRIQLMCDDLADGGARRPSRRRRRGGRPPGEVAPRRALAPGRRADRAGAQPQPAPGHLPRADGRRGALPQALPRPADERGDARCSRARGGSSPQSGPSTQTASSRSRRRSCSRATAAPLRVHS